MSNGPANLSRRFLRFALGGQRYCLAASAIRELRGLDTLVSEGDEGMGWIPVGKDLVPVHNLAERFGGAAGEKILLVDTGQGLVAAAVGHVDGIVEIENDRFHLLPAVARCPGTHRFSGVLASEGRPLLCFNTLRLGEEIGASGHRTEMLAPLKAARPASGGPAARAMVEFSTDDVGDGGAYRFGLSRTQVLELTEPLPVTPLPGAPEYVAGLTLWRDRPVAVVELDCWLGVASRGKAGAAKRFLVARAARHDEPVAFPVGGDVRLKTPPFEYRDGGTVRMTVPAARVLGWFEDAERTLVVPNLDTLFVPMAL